MVTVVGWAATGAASVSIIGNATAEMSATADIRIWDLITSSLRASILADESIRAALIQPVA